MGKGARSRDGVVPFARFFAVLGYSIFWLIIIPVGIELGGFVGWYVFKALRLEPWQKLIDESPVYENAPWVSEFWKEEDLRSEKYRDYYEPFRLWGVFKWHGKYVNTDRTEMGTWRRTINPTGPGCENHALTRIWVFGGSTVYGTGDPDWATLPSLLSATLNTGGQSCVQVTNLGIESYVTNQEVILLVEELKAGRRPDLAIFYDGINDASVGAFAPRIPTAHESFVSIKARLDDRGESKLSFLEKSYSLRLAEAVLRRLAMLRRFKASQATKLSDGELDAKAEATLANYEANLGVIRALAGAYGFNVYFFWQPVAYYGSKPLVPAEKQSIELLDREVHGRMGAIRAVYQLAEQHSRTAGGFIFLGRIFDGLTEPIYIDGAHLGPPGNELVARAIAQTIRFALPLARQPEQAR
jgi:lysophospholipase L1-like esterase